MGKNGGYRPGAGRKPFAKRDIAKTGTLKAASDKIDKLQKAAVDVLEAALGAVKAEPRIIGRDGKGAPEYEYVDVPDHTVRVRAAQILLAKRIPDLERKEHTGEDGGPILVAMDEWDKKA